ncbi:MAG TPA: ABC transporter substrate-binding protein [Firmicutes bacterium]|jgi:iron(III) transport system substrate-binding protein|nr:ABC transporter substrate-binding protein [Bacillota bacterium]
MVRRRMFGLLVVLSLVLAVAGVGLAASGKVMLYSSMQEDQLLAIKKGFEAKYPDMTMEYYFAGTGRVMTKIAAEAQAGQVGADVIWVGDPADYISFKELGILEAYESPEAAFIDDAYKDPDGYFIGARMMNMGIAYNTLFVTPEEAPKTWFDLLDPKWNDQIVMTDPGTSGTSKFWLNAIISHPKYGLDYIEKLRANGCYMESGTTATHNQIAAGAYQVGVCLDYVTATLAEQGSPIAFIFPEDTVSIFSPIGLVKNAPNGENAKLLFDFILSREGQEILIAQNLISVRNDLEQPGVNVEEIAAKALSLDLEAMVKDSDENLAAFDKLFGI